jgi:SNF family Na+-dependent transporter
MLEVQVSALAETTRFTRSFSAALLTGCAVIFGLPLCFEIRAFPVYEMISEKTLMTSCSLVTCLIFFPKKRNSLPELAPKGKTERLFTFILRFVTPAILIASALV